MEGFTLLRLESWLLQKGDVSALTCAPPSPLALSALSSSFFRSSSIFFSSSPLPFHATCASLLSPQPFLLHSLSITTTFIISLTALLLTHLTGSPQRETLERFISNLNVTSLLPPPPLLSPPLCFPSRPSPLLLLGHTHDLVPQCLSRRSSSRSLRSKLSIMAKRAYDKFMASQT